MMHEIRLQGHLDERWADEVAGLSFTHRSDGTTTLSGELADQSALHGVLNRMRDLNVPIVSVRRVDFEAVRDTPMQAVVQDGYGTIATLALAEIPVPRIGDDDVLVRVRAASVHMGDIHMMTGQPYAMRPVTGFRSPKARVRGMDLAGTVVAVGENVTRFQVGDDVFGSGDGAFAEYARAGQKTLALKPANVTFEQAAAVPTSAVTALQGLRRGEIQAGQKVLIVGASGGVGLFAVQIAKALGAEVTGVSSTSKMDMVRAAGADQVVDYTREDFTRSGQQYDLILDTGGNRALSDIRRLLTPSGTLVLVGGEGGNRLIGGGMVRSLQAMLLSPFVRQRLRPILSLTNAADLDFLKGLVEAGKVVPVIERTYGLHEAVDAMKRLQDGKAQGKLVIKVG